MTDLSSEVGYTLFFGTVAAFVLWFSYKKGFFSFETPLEEVPPLKLQHVLIVFGIYFVIAIFFSPLLASWLRPRPFSSGNALDFLRFSSWLNFLNSLTIFVLLALYFFLLPRAISRPILQNKPKATFSQDLRVAILCWVLSFPLILFTNHLLDLLVYFFFHVKELPEQLAVHFLKMTFDHLFYFFLALVTIIGLAPFIEEVLFRGFLQSYIRRHLGSMQAILITSICFAFFHYSPEQGVGNIPIIGSLFIFALFLGFIYEKQRSLAAPIFLHAAFNLISVFNLYFLGGTPPL